MHLFSRLEKLAGLQRLQEGADSWIRWARPWVQGLTKPACREPLRVGRWSGSGPRGELEPLAFEGTRRRTRETVPSAPSLRDEADSAARPLPPLLQSCT